MHPAPSSYVDVPLLDIPDYLHLDDTSQGNFAAADRLLLDGRLRQQHGDRVLVAAITHQFRLPALEHYLSSYYVARNDPKPLPCHRTALESSIARELLWRWTSADFPSPSIAVNILRLAARQLDAGDWRGGFVHCLPDRSGCSVRFPAPDEIVPRLWQIFECLSFNYTRHPVFAATVALSAISSLHPLSDGNGRLSRVMFNIIIAKRFGLDLYIPLYELSEISRGGYIISVREAQYNNSWTSLSQFILNCLLLFAPIDK